MGGGKGGSGTSTQYSGVQIPPEVMARYNQATNRAEEVSKIPWQNYNGQFVAPVNETQQAGYGTMMNGQSYTDAGWAAPNQSIQQGVGAAQPLMNQASGSINTGQAQGQALTSAGLGQAAQAYRGAAPMTQNAYQGAQGYNQAATGMAGLGMANVDPSQLNLNQFYNPFQQQVTQATMAQLNQQQAQQRNDQRGNMIREGSFGGDRSGVANANLVNQQNMATGSVLSGLNQQNFNTALSAAQQQQGVGLGAAQANRAASQWGSGQLANIGQQGYAQGLGAANQLYQQGMGQAAFTGQMGQQAYGQGIGAGQAQQGLGAANYGMYGDVAAKQAALANQAFGQNLQTAQGQIGFGSLQQQTQQAQDSALYNQWMQERGYPFQTSQFYTNAVMGTGPLSGSSAYAGAWQPQPFFSDERVKENIETIGATHDGIPIIRFNYKGTNQPQIGLSAQDVEKKHPEAVGSEGGIKTVDYAGATDASARPHKAAGGPLGSDVFGYEPPQPGLAPGVGVLGQPATMPTAGPTPSTGGSISDIVGLQRASLAANAPGMGHNGGPPSQDGINMPGSPPSSGALPTGSTPTPAPAAPAAAAGGGDDRLLLYTPGYGYHYGALPPGGSAFAGDGGSAGSGNGVGEGGGGAGPGGPGAGGGGGTGGGDATGGGTGGTYAKGGSVGGYTGGFGSLDAILEAQRAAYGDAPWTGKNAAGVGNAGIVNAQPAKASTLVKPPEMKQQAAPKSTVDEGVSSARKISDLGSDAKGAYKSGKAALFGSEAKGTPGTKGYEPETGGLFGRGGDSSRYGWLDERDNTTEASGIGNEIADWSKYSKGGDVEDVDMPFGSTSVVPEGSYDPAVADNAPKPPDPKVAEAAGSGKKKSSTGKMVGGLAAAGASLIPGGAAFAPFISMAGAAADELRRGGAAYAEGGEVPEEPTEELSPGLGAAATTPVAYGIFSRSQGHKLVGKATTLVGARRARDRRDNAYGAYDHFVKEIHPDRKPGKTRLATGGRAGFQFGGGPDDMTEEERARLMATEASNAQGLRREITPEDTERDQLLERLKPPAPGLGGADQRPRQRLDEPPGAPPSAAPPPGVGGAGRPPGAPPVVVPPSPTPGVGGAQAVANAERTSMGDINEGGVPSPPDPVPPAQPPVASTDDKDKAFNSGQGVLGRIPTIESSNSHFNKEGKPTTSTAGAVGIMQVMPKTGPEAARLAGVEWRPDLFNQPKTGDPVKDKAAEDYNRSLGTAYYNEQLRVFGDSYKAAAAYNAGPGAVTEAVRKGGAEWSKFLPAETQDYLWKISGQRMGKPLEKGVGGAKTDPGTGAPPIEPSASGLGAATPKAKSLWGDAGDWLDRNERYIVPGLSFVGNMMASKSPWLGVAIGEGLQAAAPQYATWGQRQQQLDISKQTQSIAQAGKISEAMTNISRERSGILAADPRADVSAYDKIYNQMRNKYLELVGMSGANIDTRPAGYTDYLKTQSPAIQAFSNAVSPRDDFVALYHNAMSTQDPAERERRMREADAALERARSGNALGRDGKSLGVTPEFTQSLLEWERRKVAAGSQGGMSVLKAAVDRADQELKNFEASTRGRGRNADEQKEWERLTEALAAARRAEAAGPSTRRFGGRAHLYMPKRIRKQDAGSVTGEEEEQPPVQLAQFRPEPPPPPAGAMKRPPPPTTPPKDLPPGVGAAQLSQDPAGLRARAAEAAAAGLGDVAEELYKKADDLDKARVTTGVTSSVDDTGKVSGSITPGTVERRGEEERNKNIFATNNALKEQLAKEHQQGLQAKQLVNTFRNTLFTQDTDTKTGLPAVDENGKPKLTPTTKLGVYAGQASAIAAGLQYLGLDPIDVKKATGTDAAAVEESRKLQFALQGLAAQNAVPGSALHQGSFTQATEGTPSVNLTPEAIKTMLELMERRADIQMRSPQAIRDKDGQPLPYTTDYTVPWQQWQSDPKNMWASPPKATPAREGAVSLPGVPVEAERVAGETTTVVGGVTYVWQGPIKKWQPVK
jgi:hypothetical protein